MRHREPGDWSRDEKTDHERQQTQQVEANQHEAEQEQLPLVAVRYAPALFQGVDRAGPAVDDDVQHEEKSQRGDDPRHNEQEQTNEYDDSDKKLCA